MDDRLQKTGLNATRPSRKHPRKPLAATDPIISYRWDIALDHLKWGHGAARFFGLRNTASLKTGQSFAERITTTPGATRGHTILFSNETDTGFGVPYRAIYGFTRNDGQILWLEDTGRWFAGRDGRPAFAKGVVRLTREPVLMSISALDADILVQLDRDFAALREHGGQSVLMAFAFGDTASEMDPALLTHLRAYVRLGDRMGIIGRMLVLLARACPPEDAPRAIHRLAAILAREAGQPMVSVALPIPHEAQHSITAIQRAEQKLRAHRPSQSDPLTRALRALNARNVAMACQPIVAADTRAIAFHEVLARIQDARGFPEKTEELVAALEAHGSITLLDHRILSLALDALEQDDQRILAVNVSPLSLNNADWFRYAEVRLSRRPDLASRLIFEITEQADLAMVAHAKRTLAALRDWGIRIAIDDFGMGRTSLRHLKTLRADILKIAGPFVQNLGHSLEDRQFVSAMIEMARQLKMKTVAEWVEDEATAAFLEERGIDFMQGQLFGSAQVIKGKVIDKSLPRKTALAM